MKLFVILSFLGCFVTAKAAITIDCTLEDVNDCATPEKPCDVKLDTSVAFEVNDVLVMTYTQPEAAGEASCNSVAPPVGDSGCEEYTSGEFYYKVIDKTLPNAGDVTFGWGFFLACVEACAETTADPFSGYCQATGECLALPRDCTDAKSPVGTATFVKYDPPAVLIDCNKSEPDDCGTVDNPCSISVHSAAGYEVGAVIMMTYSQVETDPETSCDGSKCEVYTSEQVYYEVEDVDAPNPDQVVMSENGFRPLCSEACALAAGEAFSGYCQAENGCAFTSGDCDKGGANPVGAIDLQAYVPPPGDHTPIFIDCEKNDENDCGTVDKPCSISLHSGAEFAVGDTIIMTYTQDKVDDEASCEQAGDDGCEAYKSTEVYYTVEDLDAPNPDQVVLSENGFRPACTEACALVAGEEFSGYCQAEAACAFVAGGCDKGGAHPIGAVSFAPYVPPSDPVKIVIDCDSSDDNDCGNVEKPCSISLHSGAGFDEGDVIIMTYTQEKMDNEASCDATGATDKGCEAYTVDEVYYTVVDLDVATENQVVMREQGFRPACTEACALVAGEAFSGYCQAAQECAFISGGCDKGGAHPVGEATFKKHDPTDTTTLPPGATTPSAATTEALAPVCAAVAALAMFT